jgi:fructose-1-phosphate kinase PfkB-like protein
VGACAEGVFEVIPPRIDVVSPIGAGDALGAAFVWSMEKKKSFAESLRWGVAAGTASAKLPGLNFAPFDQVRPVFKQVEVRPPRPAVASN